MKPKKMLRYTAIIFLIILLFAAGHLFLLSGKAAKENYPEDIYLATEPNQTAVIITAHDDDMASNAGSISLLCDKGWKIHEMCFYQQGGLYFQKDSARNPIRKQSLNKAASLQGLASVNPVDFNFRNDMQTEKSYFPMPYEKFSVNYDIDSLKKYIHDFINQHKPSVIFTLDNIIGGYGHPDHVMMSQLLVAYCKEHKSDSAFPVKKIYQAVMPPSMSESIMKDMPVYHEAKKVYQCNGMPLPDVQFEINEKAAVKKQTLQAYTTEQNSLKKIWPYYNWYPSWIYFKIFDREFYRILDVNNL